MENEIQTWGYWVMGGLQVIVIYAALRVGRLINVCAFAHDWAENTESHHFDIPVFTERLLEIFEQVKNVPIEAIVTITINFVMCYLISIGNVYVMVQIFAAAVNASMIIGFFNANRTIAEITDFVDQVEFMNIVDNNNNNEDINEK